MMFPRSRLPCRGEFIRLTPDAPLAAGGALRAAISERSAAFRRSEGGRRAPARGQMLEARAHSYRAALSSAGTTGCALHGAWLAFVSWAHSIGRAGGSIGFALLGDSLFSVAKKVSKNACPCIRAGRAMEKPEAMSSQGGLTDSCGEFVGWKTAKHFPPRSTPRSASSFVFENRWVSFALPTLHSALITASLHGPSHTTEPPLPEGRAQEACKGLSGMDAARAALGHGWPVAAGPWNVTGAREPRRSRGRMQGQAFLLTFSASGKSESPSRAKPMPRPTRPIGNTPRIPKPKSCASKYSASRSPLRSLRLGFAPTLLHPVAPRRDSNEKRPLVCA